MISVPFEIMASVKQKVDASFAIQNQIALLFSTGRCGSTLVGKAFSILPDVIVLHEPHFTLGMVGLYPCGESFDPWPADKQEAEQMKDDLDELFLLSHWVQFVSIAGNDWRTKFVVLVEAILRTNS